MTPDRGGHLVERAAPLLRREAGLAPETGTSLTVPARAVSLAGGAAPVAAPPVSAGPPPSGPPRLDMQTLQQAGLALNGQARSRISEEYRIAVGRILRALRAARTPTEPGNLVPGNLVPGNLVPGNLVMVTSARPGEGKSFTALNVAACIAGNGLGEVLLADMDSKPDSLSARLGQAGAPGMYTLVGTPTRPVEDMLVRTAINGLSFLPAGAADCEPDMNRPVSATLERLRRRFPHHVILLDCPPCLSTSDPSTLAGLVDQVIMVVEAERTQRRELEAALELLGICPNIMLVLNKVQLTTSHTFGAYHYHGPKR